MSHLSKIELEINDLTSLKEACKTLGLEFRENQKTFTWYAGKSQCDHAIHVPGASYEIGVSGSGKHEYDLIWDDYTFGGLIDRVGRNAGKLKQAYAVAKIIKEARVKKYQIHQQTLDTDIQIVLS